MPLRGGSRWASKERSKVLASKARGSGPCKMVRRPGMLRGQVGARVVPALKAGTGRQQRHEQRWGLGSPVLTVGLGVAAAEDEAWSRGSRWTSTRWCSCVDVAGSSGSACGGCRGRAHGDAATDDIEDNVNVGARWCSRTRGRRAVAWLGWCFVLGQRLFHFISYFPN